MRMYPTTCPKCKATFPETTSGGYEYTRVISIYDRDKDMTVEWECPDCQHRWPRWAKETT